MKSDFLGHPVLDINTSLILIFYNYISIFLKLLSLWNRDIFSEIQTKIKFHPKIKYNIGSF